MVEVQLEDVLYAAKVLEAGGVGPKNVLIPAHVGTSSGTRGRLMAAREETMRFLEQIELPDCLENL
jgi:hypothetical protein